MLTWEGCEKKLQNMRGSCKKIRQSVMEFFDNPLADDATVNSLKYSRKSDFRNDQVGDMGDDMAEERRMLVKMNRVSKK